MDKEKQKRHIAIEEIEALWRRVRMRRAQKPRVVYFRYVPRFILAVTLLSDLE
jgi:hypothetical protein